MKIIKLATATAATTSAEIDWYVSNESNKGQNFWQENGQHKLIRLKQ